MRCVCSTSSRMSIEIFILACANLCIWTCQEQRDSLFLSLGLFKSRFAPQLFYQFINNQLDIIAVKIVNDVLITGRKKKVEDFISAVKQHYELGTIILLPGSFLFFRLQIV